MKILQQVDVHKNTWKILFALPLLELKKVVLLDLKIGEQLCSVVFTAKQMGLIPGPGLIINKHHKRPRECT